MDEIKDTALELGVDISCLSCLQHIGIDPNVALVLVLVGSTFGRLVLDYIRINWKKKSQQNQEDK